MAWMVCAIGVAMESSAMTRARRPRIGPCTQGPNPRVKSISKTMCPNPTGMSQPRRRQRSSQPRQPNPQLPIL